MIAYLDICENNNVKFLTTDYCWTESKMDDSYSQNELKGYISFAAPDRELNVLPDYPLQIFNVNNQDIATLADAKIFLYLLSPENHTTKQYFLNAVSRTNYDVLIIDCFFNEEILTFNDVAQLKTKLYGGVRLVISYMSIGETEDCRYYWESVWDNTFPDWIEAENPDWNGNYKVKYWEIEWQNVIFGSSNAYLKKILDVGFDGVYLDTVDTFEYFE